MLSITGPDQMDYEVCARFEHIFQQYGFCFANFCIVPGVVIIIVKWIRPMKGNRSINYWKKALIQSVLFIFRLCTTWHRDLVQASGGKIISQ